MVTKLELTREWLPRYTGMSIEDFGDYVLLTKPNGETRKLRKPLFLRNPRVPDGSAIRVTQKIPRERREDAPSAGEIIRDIFAIATSALTIILLVQQLR